MNGYFKPLRRKFGVITLVVACVFAAGWVRSLYVNDVFELHDTLNTAGENAKATNVTAYSSMGLIALLRNEVIVDPVFVEGWRRTTQSGHRWTTEKWPPFFMQPRNVDKWLKHGFALWRVEKLDKTSISCVAAPYWSIVLPLTVISAWLLLSKPRAKTEPPIAEDGKR